MTDARAVLGAVVAAAWLLFAMTFLRGLLFFFVQAAVLAFAVGVSVWYIVEGREESLHAAGPPPSTGTALAGATGPETFVREERR